MTQLNDKDYRVTEMIINSRDRIFLDTNGGYQSIPRVNGELARLDSITVNNCFMSIKKDTTFSLCFKFKLDPKTYSNIQQTNSGSVTPTYHPLSNQYTAEATKLQQYPLIDAEYLVLPITVTLPAGNYTSSTLCTTLNTLLNANYDKPLLFRHFKGDTLVVATNGTYNYQFRLLSNVSVVDYRLTWKFSLWTQSDTDLAVSRPEFRATDSIALIINNISKGYTSYIYSNMVNHEIYLSGDKWFLDKLGLESEAFYSTNSLSINPGDYTSKLYGGSPGTTPLFETTAIAGFNDIVGYNSKTYQKQEVLTLKSPFLCDMKLGQGVYVCLSGFGPNAANLFDSRGVSRDAVHFMNLKMFDFGAIVVDYPQKWIYIGDKTIDNNFEVYFIDEDGDRVDGRNLNFIISLKIYSKHCKLQV